LKFEDVNNAENESVNVKKLGEVVQVSAFDNYLIFAGGRGIKEYKNDLNSAIEDYKEFQKYGPTSLSSMIRIGVCYKKLGEFKKAIHQ